jgi:acyl-CoA thioester hydrolase
MPTTEPLRPERCQSIERLAVRWGDMDSLGHVNNARYFTYFESARFRWFEDVGVWRLRRHEREGPILAATACNFRRQLKYPATIAIGAAATRLGRSSVDVDYVLWDEEQEGVVADGTSTIVWLDYGTGKSTPWPDALRVSIQAWDSLPG